MSTIGLSANGTAPSSCFDPKQEASGQGKVHDIYLGAWQMFLEENPEIYQAGWKVIMHDVDTNPTSPNIMIYNPSKPKLPVPQKWVTDVMSKVSQCFLRDRRARDRTHGFSMFSSDIDASLEERYTGDLTHETAEELMPLFEEWKTESCRLSSRGLSRPVHRNS
jgi:hypothetical protein